MKLITLISAGLAGVYRQACCACIERCSMMAGSPASGAALAAGFLEPGGRS